MMLRNALEHDLNTLHKLSDVALLFLKSKYKRIYDFGRHCDTIEPDAQDDLFLSDERFQIVDKEESPVSKITNGVLEIAAKCWAGSGFLLNCWLRSAGIIALVFIIVLGVPVLPALFSPHLDGPALSEAIQHSFTIVDSRWQLYQANNAVYTLLSISLVGGLLLGILRFKSGDHPFNH